MRRYTLFLIPTVVIFITGGLLFQKEANRCSIKEDFIELSRAKYGMLNVDEWKRILIRILNKKIDELDVSNSTAKEVRAQVSSFLFKTIDDFERDYRATNKRKSFLGISARNLGADFFDLFDAMRDQVPKITDEVVAFIKAPHNKQKLKGFLAGQLDRYATETFSAVDYSLHNQIISKYGKPDRQASINFLSELISQSKSSTLAYKLVLYLSALMLFLALILRRSLTKIELLTATLASIAVLSFGLYLPMIDIDARISEFSFTILGEPVYFSNQVIYYKSKSILEVVHLMLSQNQWDVLIVGMLVFSFSVLLPVTKLIIFSLAQVNFQIRNGGLYHFLVGKSGKWSMADVLVVAIFMAYIGFSSILTEQLSQLDRLGGSLRILTTNHSTFNVGFFLFFSFVLLSIALSDAGGRMVK